MTNVYYQRRAPFAPNFRRHTRMYANVTAGVRINGLYINEIARAVLRPERTRSVILVCVKRWST